MKFLLTFFTFIIPFIAFSQNPPPMSMPEDNQIALIEEFVKVSNYEESLKKFGMNYMYSKMFKYKNGENIRVLTKEQAEEILNKFDFKSFKEHSIYNVFSLVSEKNLNALLSVYKTLNGKIDRSGGLFISDNVIIQNFTGYLNSEIDKVTTNK